MSLCESHVHGLTFYWNAAPVYLSRNFVNKFVQLNSESLVFTFNISLSQLVIQDFSVDKTFVTGLQS